jgi:hypothetical protein
MTFLSSGLATFKSFLALEVLTYPIALLLLMVGKGFIEFDLDSAALSLIGI